MMAPTLCVVAKLGALCAHTKMTAMVDKKSVDCASRSTLRKTVETGRTAGAGARADCWKKKGLGIAERDPGQRSRPGMRRAV